MVSLGLITDHKRKRNREVCYSQVLKEVHGRPQGDVKEETAPGTHAFISARGWRALGFPGWGGIGQTKIGIWISPMRVLAKGCIRHPGAGWQGWLLMTGLLRKSYQELTLAYDFVGCYLGRALAWGAMGSFRSLQAAWQNKTDSEAATPWSRWAKLDKCFASYLWFPELDQVDTYNEPTTYLLMLQIYTSLKLSTTWWTLSLASCHLIFATSLQENTCYSYLHREITEAHTSNGCRTWDPNPSLVIQTPGHITTSHGLNSLAGGCFLTCNAFLFHLLIP